MLDVCNTVMRVHHTEAVFRGNREVSIILALVFCMYVATTLRCYRHCKFHAIPLDGCGVIEFAHTMVPVCVTTFASRLYLSFQRP